MVFLFITPFRTDFNLSSLEAIGDRETIVDVLLETVKGENEGSSGFHWTVPWDKEQKGELHYSELNEDFVPDSATPLLNLDLPPEYIKNELDLRSEEPKVGEYDITQCSVLYYDNTVGILTLEVSFSDGDVQDEIFSIIDKWSTEICSSIISLIESYETSVLSKIRSISKIRKKAIFLHPKEFIVFFDRFESSMASTDKKVERMLWVTRLYQGSVDENQSEVLERWTQNINLHGNALSLGDSKISACVGNSVVSGTLSKDSKYALETALQISTYFYVLYDVFNKVLKLLYLEMSNGKKAKESTISRVNRIRPHIEFMENEFGDVLMGLQGKRAAIANRFMEAWSYEYLVKAVQKKKDSVGRFSESILREKQSKYGRVVEAFLAAIGGVSLLDFILNLFSYSNDRNSDAVPGLVDSVEHLPVDGVLYVALALLVFVLILVLRKR